jgi:hypothetical protein
MSGLVGSQGNRLFLWSVATKTGVQFLLSCLNRKLEYYIPHSAWSIARFIELAAGRAQQRKDLLVERIPTFRTPCPTFRTNA